MTESNIMSGNSPQGQVPGENQQGVTPPVEENKAVVDDNQQPAKTQEDNQPPQLSAEELEALRAKANKWENYRKRNRQAKREERQQAKVDIDDNDPDTNQAIRIRDDKIQSLSTENFTLKTKQSVSELLDNEDYKGVPRAIKTAITKNPLGFVSPTSESVEDALYDIQDYLDDLLDDGIDNTGSIPTNPGDRVEVKIEGKEQTPPVNNSGPAPTKADEESNLEGKTGSARSTAILQGLLKGIKKS